MDSVILGPKRPCPGEPFPRLYAGPASMDRLLESLLTLSDPSLSLDLSLERLVDSRTREPEKELLIEAAMDVGSALLEAAMRSARKRASSHNSASWPLPPDLTVKVFSMLDTRSLCHAAATCSMFNKCAMDPLCYANIDLTAMLPKVNNTVVSTMIQRAGRNLQSLKLGAWSYPASSAVIAQQMSCSTRNSMNAWGPSWNEKKPRQGRESCVLTRSCLLALSVDGGAAGALMKKLHLYNIDKMDSSSLCMALSACQGLLDLEVIGLHAELRRTLEAVSTYCHAIQRLFFESSEPGRDDSLKSPTCVGLVNGCPNLLSISFRGFKLHDHKAKILVKGLCYLKVVDFSTSYSITGTFLRNLGNRTNAAQLEVLILRDCLHLKEVEVVRFLDALITGDCKLLRYLVGNIIWQSDRKLSPMLANNLDSVPFKQDISNKDGLSAEADWNNRCYSPSIPILRVSEERPDISIVAKFPQEGSFIDVECTSESQISSSSNLQLSPDLAFDIFSPISYDNYFSSDQGSGSEDVNDSSLMAYDGDSLDSYHSSW